MKKLTKRILSVILATTLAFSIVSCKKADTKVEVTPTPTPTVAPTEAATPTPTPTPVPEKPYVNPLAGNKLGNMKDIILFPVPRTVKWNKGEYEMLSGNISGDAEIANVVTRVSKFIKDYTEIEIAPELSTAKQVIFTKDSKLKPQGYTLKIDDKGINITYADPQGALYASSTLKQLVYQRGAKLPYVNINDYPDFEKRAYQMDVSRNRTPSVETLKLVVDMLADLKYNQFMIYIEGFSFAYPSFPQVWLEGTPLTPENIKEVDLYCKQYNIEFVPDLNSFAHVGQWTGHPDFKKYAEAPDGYKRDDGSVGYSSMFSLTEPETLKFVGTLYSDYFPNFTSGLALIGGDETEEIGKGKSARLGDDKGQIYLKMLTNLYDLCKKNGKTMMYWADIVRKYPEIIEQLPKDAIGMDWGYEFDYNFDTLGDYFSTAGINYYVCPGAATWSVVVPRITNMTENVYDAALSGIEYGAMGYLLTDWGDNGHMNHLSMSYPAIAYSAAVSWNLEGNAEVDYGKYLSRFVFNDETEQLGNMLVDVGRNADFFPRAWNNTWLNIIYNSPYTSTAELESFDQFSPGQNYPEMSQEEQCQAAIDLCDKFLEKLKTVKLYSKDAEIVMAEMDNNVRLLRAQGEYAAMRLRVRAGSKYAAELKKANEQLEEVNQIKVDFKKTWLMRDLQGALDDSVNRPNHMSNFYNTILLG